MATETIDQQTRPRRHSYPVRPQELTGQNDEDDSPKPNRSASLETSPLTAIRLGSKVAKQAAKSFWNMDMLHESLQKIKQYAAIESSSLGSSIESDNEEDDDPLMVSTEECKCLFPIAPHLMSLPFSLTSCSEPSSPTQSPKIALKRPHSAYAERKIEKKISTIQRKISPSALTPTTAVKVRFHLFGSEHSLDGEQKCILRKDDGFHEPY